MPAKRVDIVRCKLVKECPSIRNGPRVIHRMMPIVWSSPSSWMLLADEYYGG